MYNEILLINNRRIFGFVKANELIKHSETNLYNHEYEIINKTNKVLTTKVRQIEIPLLQ